MADDAAATGTLTESEPDATSATGGFNDDFSKRSQPFVDAVTQSRSKTVGTVTEARRCSWR